MWIPIAVTNFAAFFLVSEQTGLFPAPVVI
jgi:hypothetical protein